MILGSRLHATQRLLESEVALDALIIQEPQDVRWLTGFSGSSSAVVVRASGVVILVDGRYGDQAVTQAPDCEVMVWSAINDRERRLQDLLAGCRRVGFDDRKTSVAEWKQLAQIVSGELVGVSYPLARLRCVKDETEVAMIERAASAADRAFLEVLRMVGSLEMTERDVRDELESQMRRHGADSPAYSTIVASGPNSAFPHHRPTDRLIREGDSVVIDVGAEIGGYRSDMTRTLLIGEVDPILRTLYDVVNSAQQAVVAAVAPGVMAGSLHELACDKLSQYRELILHSTGHGVGLDIHESPWLRQGSTELLQVNHVVTVEPGLYRVGIGGVRIEDLLLVEPTGSRILTNSPKDPLCLSSAPTT